MDQYLVDAHPWSDKCLRSHVLAAPDQLLQNSSPPYIGVGVGVDFGICVGLLASSD